MTVEQPFRHSVRGRRASARLQRVWDAGKRVGAERGHRVFYTHVEGVAPL